MNEQGISVQLSAEVVREALQKELAESLGRATHSMLSDIRQAFVRSFSELVQVEARAALLDPTFLARARAAIQEAALEALVEKTKAAIKRSGAVSVPGRLFEKDDATA